MKPLQLFAILLSLTIADNALALRCGNSVIGLGKRKQEVREKCGYPISIEKHRKVLGRTLQNYPKTMGLQEYEEITVEEWVYDFGPRRLRQYLRFENGRLVEIENMGRGE